MIIRNKDNGKILASKAWECRTLLERCRGLMLRKITPEEGCVLVNESGSILESSIHMILVPQDLDVIWLDEDYKVITVKKCRKANILTWWRTYSPSRAAKYVIEVLNAKGTLPGDRIQFIK